MFGIEVPPQSVRKVPKIREIAKPGVSFVISIATMSLSFENISSEGATTGAVKAMTGKGCGWGVGGVVESELLTNSSM